MEDKEDYTPRTHKKQKKKAKYNVTKVPGVEEGVDVLEVPIQGHPVTTMEVSVKWGNKGNTQKSVCNGKMREYACTNNF